MLGLNLSKNQIAQELNLKQSTAQNIARTLREKILENKPKAKIKDKDEIDEVYVVSGHKGHPVVYGLFNIMAMPFNPSS